MPVVLIRRDHMRKIPNPESIILKNAIIGGAGITIQPNIETPTGMAAVLLFVPLDQVIGKTTKEIQCDVGLPWVMNDGESFWFDDIDK